MKRKKLISALIAWVCFPFIFCIVFSFFAVAFLRPIFDIDLIKEFFPGIYIFIVITASVFGAPALIIIRKCRSNLKQQFFIFLIAGIIGALVWGAIGCSLFHDPEWKPLSAFVLTGIINSIGIWAMYLGVLKLIMNSQSKALNTPNG